MRFVAGQVAAMAELLLARALWRSSIGKMLPLRWSQWHYREDAAVNGAAKMPSGRCCFQWRSKDAIGKMLPVGEATEKPAGRG